MRYIVFIFLVSSLTLRSQFISATLRVDGLTCSMCSKTVYKALSELNFIDSLTPNLQTASFRIIFKKDVTIDPNAMQQKVSGAGFSVGELKLDYKFDNFSMKNGTAIKSGSNEYQFFSVKDEVLNGLRSFKIINSGFVSKKEFKRYSTKPEFKQGLTVSALNHFVVTF